MSHDLDSQSPKLTPPDLRRDADAANDEGKPSQGGRTGLVVAFGMIAMLVLLVCLNMG